MVKTRALETDEVNSNPIMECLLSASVAQSDYYATSENVSFELSQLMSRGFSYPKNVTNTTGTF